MAKYDAGTIAVQGGSDIVYGDTDVNFIGAGVNAGDALIVWGLDRHLTIKEVINARTLRVDVAISGANGLEGLAYAIGADFTPILELPIFAPNSINTFPQATRFMTILDRELIASITGYDGGIGSNPAATSPIASS